MPASSPDYGWTLAPLVLLALAAYLVVYVLRWRRSRRIAGPRGASLGQLAAFVTAILLLFVALVSPVDRLAEQLMTMHMVQHLLLIDLAPIALMLGLSKVILRPVSRVLIRLERRAGPFGHPAFGVVVYVGAMTAYHVPAVYDLTLRSELAHAVAHVALVAAGCVYWWHLLSPVRQRLRLGGLGPVVYMVSTKLLVGFLGVALAFAPTVLYDAYEGQPDYWGLDRLADQNVAGLLMGLEQSIVMGIALAVLFARALTDSDRADARADRLNPTG